MENETKTKSKECCDDSTPADGREGMTRRGFLAGMGVGTAAVVAAGTGSANAAPKSKTVEFGKTNETNNKLLLLQDNKNDLIY